MRYLWIGLLIIAIIAVAALLRNRNRGNDDDIYPFW